MYPNVNLVLSASRDNDLEGSPGDNNDESAYLLDEAREVRRRTVREVMESVQIVWNDLTVSRRRLSYLAKYHDATRSTVKAYAEQFKLGKRTLFDLLNVENEAFQASLEYIDRKCRETLSEYRVLNNMGLLMHYAKITLPVMAKLHNKGLL